MAKDDGGFIALLRRGCPTPRCSSGVCEIERNVAADELERLTTQLSEQARSLSGAVGIDPPNFWESVNCVDSMKDELERLREKVTVNDRHEERRVIQLRAKHNNCERALDKVGELEATNRALRERLEKAKAALEVVQRGVNANPHSHECPGWECAECDWQSWDDVTSQALREIEEAHGRDGKPKNIYTPLVEYIKRLRSLEEKTRRAEPSNYLNDIHPAAAAGDIAAYRAECEAVLEKMREIEEADGPDDDPADFTPFADAQRTAEQEGDA